MRRKGTEQVGALAIAVILAAYFGSYAYFRDYGRRGAEWTTGDGTTYQTQISVSYIRQRAFYGKATTPVNRRIADSIFLPLRKLDESILGEPIRFEVTETVVTGFRITVKGKPVKPKFGIGYRF